MVSAIEKHIEQFGGLRLFSSLCLFFITIIIFGTVKARSREKNKHIDKNLRAATTIRPPVRFFIPLL